MPESELVVKRMNLNGPAENIQRIQTAHRLKLIDFWNIGHGARVLEIGCGQGDTLAALAYAVGENGFVHGVDIADDTYGQPETLGQARKRLLCARLGAPIRIDFSFDVLDESRAFADDAFDVIVLSHSLWYLPEYDSLAAILRRVRPWGKRLCIAEWSSDAETMEQLPHLKAVMVQAVCESFLESGYSNVRTLYTPRDIHRAVEESGWVTQKAGMIHSPDMQDGRWEVLAAIERYADIQRGIAGMPEKLRQLLCVQIEELRQAGATVPLPVYALTAVRA